MDAGEQVDVLGTLARAYGEAELAPARNAIELIEGLEAIDSGELQRAREAASLLAELRLDPPAVAAALLEPVFAAGQLAITAIQRQCGRDTASLTETVSRLRGIHWAEPDEQAAENLRKMFLAMAADARGVIVALAHRVARIRTLDDVSAPERLRHAQESLDLFAPLANRLGIWQFKWELEDLALAQLDAAAFEHIRTLLAESTSTRTQYIDRCSAILRQELSEVGVQAKISGRPKHIYSIYRKMRRKGVEFDRIYDVTALRTIVGRIQDCYAVLGIVHTLWTPVPGEFDDYIAKPKNNHYQSLHTAVIGPEGKPLEVQIRTDEMHRFAEYGIAAHWRYKEGRKAERVADEKIDWLRQLMEAHKDVHDVREVVESLKTDVFQDQVYVFTPKGDVIALPSGATPLDFAYRVHTDIGHACRGARVNGQIVTLDRRLTTGDRVEIITGRTTGPSRDWLNANLGFVRTSGARQKIRQWFRRQERETVIAQARELVERELRRLGMDKLELEYLAMLCKFDDEQSFLAALGFGDISLQQVAARLLETEQPAPSSPRPSSVPRPSGGIVVDGVSDVLSAPARCCNPVPGDAVVGLVTRGRGLVIHRQDCANVRNFSEPGRLVDVSWGSDAGTYPVSIRVLANDRPGLMRDISDVVSKEGVSMSSTAAASSKGATAVVTATLLVRSSEQVVRILNRIDQLSDVLEARRTRQ